MTGSIFFIPSSDMTCLLGRSTLSSQTRYGDAATAIGRGRLRLIDRHFVPFRKTTSDLDHRIAGEPRLDSLLDRLALRNDGHNFLIVLRADGAGRDEQDIL